ncbi:hypothetical protein [Cognatiyoonia sp. IB215182]|uniref:hypothetical protein n=1 Tax=Cognatiyoonia sp. IB215182 TaxID=3097353 RepID=UPI002A0E4016|nr:hypothetical protein [Cognatiyoonia sp. IB215182]MDX8353948.1 hypothetical protein [Cognatiyoonia sp. IB215182]
MGRSHIERALFLLGEPDTGKSTQLRSLFLDRRLGSNGRIPRKPNLKDTYPLSNERWLYVRLTSPHEADETEDDFLEKCDAKMSSNVLRASRWNFAGALQLTAGSKLAKGTDIVDAFAKRFAPERIRAVLLSPDRHGNYLSKSDQHQAIQSLRSVGTEIIMVDATSRTANGLVYADFFDFT